MMMQSWKQIGSLMATFMFVYSMFRQLFPPPLRARFQKYTNKFTSFVYPYIRITFHEFTGERLMRSEAFSAIQIYLSEYSSQKATKLKAISVKDSNTPLVLSMADNEEITEEFQGVKLWWASHKYTPKTQSFSMYPAADEKRYYKLTFHKRYRDLIIESYLKHVFEEAKAIEMKNRQLKLYSNSKTKWSHVIFEHPATFETLALLYGPPGTGKSSMIAAMANFMNYDVYDLELTSVKDNSDLRNLLINTSSKSIIVIEDIDCSLNLTGQRKKKEKKSERKGGKGDEDEKGSEVTLSGLLNVIDGIWSACGGERIIIFTTNFVDKIDPALIRRGRMDVHIELSYCCYEAFKVLAKNYLDAESHHLFPRIEELLGETKMSPADVAENLMPKSVNEEVDTCLQNLIQALETSKEDAKKAEEKVRKKAEEDEVVKKAEKERKLSNLQENATENHGEEMKDNGVIH